MALDIDHTPIRVMDPAITARLRLAFPTKTFALQRVPLTPSRDEFKRLMKTLPFLGLAWAGFQPDGENGRQTKGAMQWRLYLFNRASNGLEARFKGDRISIGLDAMVDVAVLLLNGAVLEDIGTSQVTRAGALHAEGYADDDVAMASIDFTVRFTSSPGVLKLVDPGDFETLGITWLLAGQGEGDGPAPTGEIDLTGED